MNPKTTESPGQRLIPGINQFFSAIEIPVSRFICHFPDRRNHHRDVQPATAEAMAEIQTAVDLLVEEVRNPEPNALVVAKETKRLGAIGSWAATKADRFADSFATTLGIAAATVVGAAAVRLGPELTHLLTSVVTHLCNWLGYIVQPF